MAGPVDENQENVIEEAARQFVDAKWQGREPDIEELVKKHPQLEHQIRQRIQDIKKIDTLFDSLVQTDKSDFEDAATGQDLVGRKIGGFEIVKVIGRGGMGVVYLAHDTKLDRSVAVKSIPAKLADDSTARMRFHREAKLLASLNHPNIAVIHEIIEQEEDLSYLILEYVPGESLAQRISREPLKLEEALSIGQQIAEAISAAHKKGVVHRDLKPGNIRLEPDGRVKVLDFGLAKTSVRKGTDIEITSTEPGHIIGTPAYMSPEQARGKSTDHRTDIWSFGCIIYQMLTGHSPFESDTATDTMARIIERQPDWELLPNETPENIRVLLRRCLEKDPERRLGNIADAAIEIRETLNLPATTTASKPAAPVRTLWRWVMAIGFVLVAIVVGLKIGRWREQLPTGAVPGRIKSLAVLPLEYRSGDPNQEYYADAMTDELISYLGKIGTLRVISRQSVMQYKGSDKPLPEIARELNVDAVVEGTVLCGSGQIRITAQLIGAVPERTLWGDNYDRDFGDIVILSSEVAQAIAREIKVAITPTEQARLTSARPVNPEAYTLYRRGKDHYFKGIFLEPTKKELEKANEYFQQAIEIDPNYAQAYAGLAGSYVFLSWAGHLPLDEAKSKTIALLSKALELDYKLAEAHHVLSGVLFVLCWDWMEGERETKLAIELKPNLAEAHYNYAYYLMAMGRFAESIAEAKCALQLDPLSYAYECTLATMYYCARQYEQAIGQYQHIAELKPKESRSYWDLARTYVQMERYEEAVQARQKALSLSGAQHEEVEALARAYNEEGPKGYWIYHLERLKGQYEHKPYSTARIYAQLGDKEQAFAWLEKAYEKHDGGLLYLKVEPLLDPLHDDPRFDDLLRRMNFPE
ncbi:MAG: protein kinase [Planctomycetes bacterium]|nr:protein kinase [Planctomycetota bacterium]